MTLLLSSNTHAALCVHEHLVYVFKTVACTVDNNSTYNSCNTSPAQRHWVDITETFHHAPGRVLFLKLSFLGTIFQPTQAFSMSLRSVHCKNNLFTLFKTVNVMLPEPEPSLLHLKKDLLKILYTKVGTSCPFHEIWLLDAVNTEARNFINNG